MGKWSKLKGSYPKAPIDGTILDKIAAVLDAPAPAEVTSMLEIAKGFRIRDLSDFQIVQLYNSKRQYKDNLEAQIKVLNLEIDAFTSLLVERFDEAGVEKATFDDGTTISINTEPYPYVTSQPALLKWVRDNELEEMLSLNYQTMASLVKDCITNGKKLPDGVDVYLRDKLSRRGGKEKQSE